MLAKNKVIKFIKENKSATIQQLSLELADTLGFGVNVEDIVSVLVAEGKVTFDPISDLVRISNDEIIKEIRDEGNLWRKEISERADKIEAITSEDLSTRIK